MIKTFIKRNWLYIILFSLIVALNVMPHSEEALKNREVAAELSAEKDTQNKEIFTDFKETEERSKLIEKAIKNDLTKYIFYMSVNLSIVLIFFLGIFIDGFFLIGKRKGINFFPNKDNPDIPKWQIGDILRIIILSFIFSYAFFILFGFAVKALENILNIKFTFYNNENLRMVFDTIILDAMVFVVVLGFIVKTYKRKLKDLGFSKKGLMKNIGYGISGYIGVIPVIFIIGMIVYVILNLFKIKPPLQPIVGLLLNEKNTTLILISSIVASLFGPVIEEIFFRGVMYNAIKAKIGIFWSILITSVLFSFLHTHALEYFLVGFIPIAILGAFLAYLYEKTGSLIPSITLHILNNVGSVVIVIVFKYFNSLIG